MTSCAAAWSAEGLSQIPAPKPSRQKKPWVEAFLSASEQSESPGWLRFGADLVGLRGSAQQNIGRDLKAQCRAARGGDRERSLTTHGSTSVGSWLLTAAAVPKGAETDHLPRYMDAKQYQTQASRSMLLLYGIDGTLFGSRFCGDPETRSAERDAEISVTPLRSLASTFGILPRSARRRTKQLPWLALAGRHGELHLEAGAAGGERRAGRTTASRRRPVDVPCPALAGSTPDVSPS